MVFCFVALVVFGVLGIFSASHRRLAKEAFDCVFRRVTLRACESDFDRKMKTKISTGLLKYNKSIARFFFKYFEWISWALVVLTVASALLVLAGVYNFAAFGNCNGPAGGFCLYNSLLPNAGKDPSALQFPVDFNTGIFAGSGSASVTIVEFGCFSCPYTKQAETVVAQALREFDGKVNLLWKPFPLPAHPFSREAAIAAACAAQQGKFAEYKTKLFENQLLFAQEGAKVFNEIARQLNLSLSAFSDCQQGGSAAGLVAKTAWEGQIIGIYGTPTFFIGTTVLVGPPAYGDFRAAILKELEKKGTQ